MSLFPKPVAAQALSGYRLALQYADGVSGIWDLSDSVGKGVFTYWSDERNFPDFKIDSLGKLSWNEELEIDPDSFYLQLIGKTFEEYAGD